jgi:hypothetical protein
MQAVEMPDNHRIKFGKHASIFYYCTVSQAIVAFTEQGVG